MAFKIDWNDENGEPKKRTVKRYDRAPLEAPTKTPEGFMRGQGLLTRVGVFDYYVQGDGDEIVKVRELRPPEEVFSDESLRSFALVPLTLDHPPKNLTPETVRNHQVGAVGTPSAVEDHVRADLLITQREAIEAVEKGRNQLSCGYVCQTEFRSGVFTDAKGARHEFDCVQRNIRGNHVAIVDQGRAGSTSAIRLDAGDGVIDYTDAQNEKEKTMLINVGDQEFEVPDAVGKRLNALEEVAKKAKEETPTPPGDSEDIKKEPKEDQPVDPGEGANKMGDENEMMAMKGRIAALEAAMADKAKTDAADKLRRVKVEASGVLGVEETKLDGKDLVAIQKEVIAKVLPSMRLDSDEPAYIGAVYSTALQVQTGSSNSGGSSDRRHDTNEDIKDAMNRAKDQTKQDGDENDMSKAYDSYVAKMSNRWKAGRQRA